MYQQFADDGAGRRRQPRQRRASGVGARGPARRLPAGQPRSGRAGRRRRGRLPRSARASSRRSATGRSCSIWATACCRRPIPLRSARWSSYVKSVAAGRRSAARREPTRFCGSKPCTSWRSPPGWPGCGICRGCSSTTARSPPAARRRRSTRSWSAACCAASRRRRWSRRSGSASRWRRVQGQWSAGWLHAKTALVVLLAAQPRRHGPVRQAVRGGSTAGERAELSLVQRGADAAVHRHRDPGRLSARPMIAIGRLADRRIGPALGLTGPSELAKHARSRDLSRSV